MKPTNYAVIAILVVAALVLRLFGPKGEVTWLSSPGSYRGFPVNILAFWFFIILAIALGVIFVMRRSHPA